MKDINYDMENKSDFVDIGSTIFNHLNFKIALILFFIGVIIFSDLFVEYILKHGNGLTEDNNPTTNGVLVQIGMLTFFYLIIDLLNSLNVI
jgi:hypothetical protein